MLSISFAWPTISSDMQYAKYVKLRLLEIK
jgi:hypothetical protein